MDENTAASLRLVDARLEALEMAVAPKPIRRDFDGKPRPPEPWEPGEERPKPDWILVRLMAVEAVVGLILTADEMRSDGIGETGLAEYVEADMAAIELGMEAEAPPEPDLIRRLQVAVLIQAREVVSDRGTWLRTTVVEPDDD